MVGLEVWVRARLLAERCTRTKSATLLRLVARPLCVLCNEWPGELPLRPLTLWMLPLRGGVTFPWLAGVSWNDDPALCIPKQQVKVGGKSGW